MGVNDQTRTMPEKANPLINLAAGGISGAVSKTLTAPLEKVKLAIQNQDSNPRILSGEMQRYKGMGDCFSRHISELGASSLWRGNVANCVRYVPTAAFNLMFKDTIKGMFPKVNKEKDFTKFALTQVSSGALAGGLTNTLVYQLIYVRTVLGADLGKVKKYSSMADCIQKTVKEGGVMSLYNGIGPSSVGIVVYRGVQFGIAAYPFDTMQRRLQIEASKPKSEQIYNGMGDCFKKIMAAEGPGGFFKGAMANILRGTGAAIVLVMYDEIMNAVERAGKK